jgi:fatty acid desaturase
LAVIVSLGITAVFTDFSSMRWLSLFTLLIIGVWLVAVRYAGHQFRLLTETTPEGERASRD